MEFSYRTPLLDMFRRGEVPADVRMQAACGALAPRAHEQLALLILLTDDEDEGIAMAANETIGRIPREALAGFLGRPDVPEEIRAFFRARGIDPIPGASPDAAQPLVAQPAAGEEPADEDREATAMRLSKMNVGERIKHAMLGTREERFILIRDVNRLVAAAVLSSPKVNESDVEAFAKMMNVSEDVLRTIAHSRQWMKNYNVTASLALNPKTPIAVSLGLVGRLIERDLKAIMRDRNMPEALRGASRRLLSNTSERKV